MDLEFVKWIQSFRNPILDWFFYLVTQLGDQIVFILVAVIIYWTIDKKFAHKFVFTFMISAIVNSSLKEIFKRPRPYNFSGVSMEEAWYTTGFSFPSGHAQASGVLGYTLLHSSKKLSSKLLKYLGIFVLVFVPLSRIYLGQHFLTDVLVGVLLALLVAKYIFKLVDLMGDEEHTYTLMIAPLFILAMFFVRNHDLYIAAGGFVGFAFGYFVEKKYVAYQVKEKLYIQIIKVIFGLIGVLIIKEGLKIVFPDFIIFDFFRYLLIGAWAALGAPFVFKHGTRYLKKNI